MPIEGPLSHSKAGSIEPSSQPQRTEGMKPLERKVEKAVENVGVLPEAPPPLLTQREITQFPALLPTNLSSEHVTGVLSTIMKEKNITSTADIGIEAVAAHHFTEGMNKLLQVAGYSTTGPEYGVQSVSTKSFPKVDLIFTQAGVTITGIEKEQAPAFLEELLTVHPELQRQVASFSSEGKVSVVSKESVAGIEQMAGDRFSEIATELRDRLESEPSSEEEAVEKPEISEEKEVEKERPMSAEPALSQEKVVQERSNITQTSLVAAEINMVVSERLFRFVAPGFWRAERHEQEETAKKEREDKEIQRENLKQDIKHDELKRTVEKEDTAEAEAREKGALRAEGKLEAENAIGTYVERKKAGEPASPPNLPTTA